MQTTIDASPMAAGSLVPTPGKPDDSPFSGLTLLQRLTDSIERCEEELRRIADHFNPPLTPIVGTDYIASRLGLTPERITQMTREGDVPPHCLVEGSGNGKPWKYHRRHVDAWLKSR